MTNKHIYKALFFCGLMNVWAHHGMAQGVSSYNYEISYGTYTPITSPLNFQSGSDLDDDAVSNSIPLNDTFFYNGANYNSLYISNNGYIILGDLPPSENNVTPLSQSSVSSQLTDGYDAAISAFGCNLVKSNLSGSSSSIDYAIENNTFVIQYTDMARVDQGQFEKINCQIRLNLITDEIHLVYGDCIAGFGTTIQPQVGLRGCGDRDFQTLSGNDATAWDNPNVNLSNGGAAPALTLRTSAIFPSSVPISGLTYSFLPPPPLPDPIYSATPFFENFESDPWLDGQAPQQLPSMESIRSWPVFGDRSIRRHNTTSESVLSGWSSTNGVYLDQPSTSACFNSHGATSGTSGYMDFYVNLLTSHQTLSFEYYNPSGSDFLEVFLSTDGGETFGEALATYYLATTWTNNTVDLGQPFSTTCVVRILCTGDVGVLNSNIGIDNISIGEPCSGQPFAGLDATIVADSDCEGSNLTMSFGDGYSTDGVIYSWFESLTGLPDSFYPMVNSSSAVLITNSVGGLHYYMGIVTCPESGLSDSTEVLSIEINPTEQPVILISENTACSGELFGVTASNGDFADYVYSWSVNSTDAIVNITTLNSADIALQQSSTIYLNAANLVTGCETSSEQYVQVYETPSTTIILEADVCINETTDIENNTSMFTCISYSYLPVPDNATYLINDGILHVPLIAGNSDDGGWGAIPIGFAFDYFGVTHTECAIITNGNIQFPINPSQINTTYGSVGSIPSPNSPNNYIALCFADLTLVDAGNIKYWTFGTAPQRVFVVDYQNVPFFTNSSATFSGQCHIYESGRFEIHIAEIKPSTQAVTIGCENSEGTLGDAADNCLTGEVDYWQYGTGGIEDINPQAWQFIMNNYNLSYEWSPQEYFIGNTSGSAFENISTMPFQESGTYEITLQLTDLFSGCMSNESWIIEVDGSCVYGCMDNLACNYNPSSTIDNESCDYSCIGCTDPLACNYSLTFTIEDGSCLYGNACNGCTDPLADNYNPQVTIDDGSCDYHGTIIVFQDLNNNGVQDVNESGLPNWSVFFSQLSITMFSDMNGIITFDLLEGQYYVDLSMNEGWSNTTPVNGIASVPGTFYFGVQDVDMLNYDVNQTMTTDFVCTSGVDPIVCVYNSGGVPFSANLSLTCDELLLPLITSINQPPTSVSPGSAIWNDIELPVGNSATLFRTHIDSPGLQYVGSSYDFVFHLTLTDPNGNIFYDETWAENRTLTCSYDPNEISANPIGYADPHFINAGQRIHYLIKYQNTGTAPAEDISILDQLSPEIFDLPTFQPISYSFNTVACLHDDGIVDFIMNDINLPDSTTNEPGSHGYVLYRVDARSDLAPNSILPNHASIFFDQNAAVITNEVYHTIFDCSSFTGIDGDMDLCENELIVLDATQPYVESYVWNVDGDIYNGSSIALSDLPTGPHNIQLNTSNPLCNADHTNTLTVHPTPTLDAGMDMSVCEGNSLLLNATSNTDVIWSNALANGSEYTPVATETLTVSATSTVGCTVTDDLQITVSPLPSGDVTMAGNVLTAASGASWQWYYNDNLLEGETSQTLITNGGGTYHVIITSEDGCSTISQTVMVVGMEDSKAYQVLVYPNPMTDRVTIALPASMNKITLTDASGRIVYSKENCAGIINLTKTDIASGMYHLMVQQNHFIYTTKLIVN